MYANANDLRYITKLANQGYSRDPDAVGELMDGWALPTLPLMGLKGVRQQYQLRGKKV